MDLIDRNEAIEAVDGKLGEFNANNKAVSILMHLPSVEPVKHGRWIVNECSLCGFLTTEWVGSCHYCPNCGARMDGEQDG